MRNVFVTAAAFLVIQGCASIDLSEVDPEKLRVDIEVTQDQDEVFVGAEMTRGMFRQPVKLAGAQFETVTPDDVYPMKPANRDGRYSTKLIDPAQPISIELENFGSVDIPYLTPVSLTGAGAIEGRLFFKDDLIELDLPAAYGDERYLVATAYCGRTPYTTYRRISTEDGIVGIPIEEIRRRVNDEAEADLNGVLEVELQLEEHYRPNDWPRPFNDVVIRSVDGTVIDMDTTGFRVKIDVAVQVSNNFSLNLQNQQWPVRYCL